MIITTIKNEVVNRGIQALTLDFAVFVQKYRSLGSDQYSVILPYSKQELLYELSRIAMTVECLERDIIVDGIESDINPIDGEL